MLIGMTIVLFLGIAFSQPNVKHNRIRKLCYFFNSNLFVLVILAFVGWGYGIQNFCYLDSFTLASHLITVTHECCIEIKEFVRNLNFVLDCLNFGGLIIFMFSIQFSYTLTFHRQ